MPFVIYLTMRSVFIPLITTSCTRAPPGGDIWAHPAGADGQICRRGYRLMQRGGDPSGGLRVRARFDRTREVVGGSGFRRRLRQRLRFPPVRGKYAPCSYEVILG